MIYDESLDYGTHGDHELNSTRVIIHGQGVVNGRPSDEYDCGEGSNRMEGGHYQVIPQAMVELHETEDIVYENGDDLLHRQLNHEMEMVEMEETIDESGQRILIRPGGNIMYHPDDFILDEDGSTMTWRLVDEEGQTVDPSQPVSFDVSAYEVCVSASACRNGSTRLSRGRQMTHHRRFLPPIHSNQRFARLDRSIPRANPRHAKISRMDVSRGRAQGKRGEGTSSEGDPSSSCSSIRRLPPPTPNRVPRRPTAKISTQSTLAHATSGLETANCNYCHLRFYMPRTALRSRIHYGLTDSQFDLPNAFFECPICGMESASGPSSSRR